MTERSGHGALIFSGWVIELWDGRGFPPRLAWLKDFRSIR